MTRVVGSIVLSLLNVWAQPSAVAANLRELRALATTIEQDLQILDKAQLMYGGWFPPQLVTDIGRHARTACPHHRSGTGAGHGNHELLVAAIPA